MPRKDIYSPETWRELYEENFEDASVMLGYCAAMSDVISFVNNLPKDLPAEAFQAQILDLCSRGEALTEDISRNLCERPSWSKFNPEQK